MSSTVARDFRTGGAAGSRSFASQILRDQLEVPERSLAFRARRLERPFEAMAHVVVNQCLLGAFNCALHGLQLLSDLDARPAVFDHFDDRFEVAIGAFQTTGDRGMRVVHEILLSSWQDISDPPRRIEKWRLTAIQVRRTCPLLSRTLRSRQAFQP